MGLTERPLAIGDRYILTPSERDEIKAIARERSASNRQAGVRDSGIGPSTGAFKDMVGAAGEWAFAQLAHSEFDQTISPRSYLRGEDAGDTMFRGVCVDVKSTHYTTGKLVVAPWRGQGDGGGCVYALMVLTDRNGPTFEFKGFANADLVRANPADLGHGPTFAVPQRNLQEWWAVPEFQETCIIHGVLACLDCPDPFTPEPDLPAAEIEF